tara:strand:- start:336 stop:524 length:189 start_codon:yes stop_codon:yes gene_type:complete
MVHPEQVVQVVRLQKMVLVVQREHLVALEALDLVEQQVAVEVQVHQVLLVMTELVVLVEVLV